MLQLTHFDSAGQAHMVGVNGKAVTHYVAVVTDTIRVLPETFTLVHGGSARKGDVLGIVCVTVIQDFKRTSDSIPLCYPLALAKVAMEFSLDKTSHTARCMVRVETCGQTGAEIETLTAVQVGFRFLYTSPSP